MSGELRADEETEDRPDLGEQLAVAFGSFGRKDDALAFARDLRALLDDDANRQDCTSWGRFDRANH